MNRILIVEDEVAISDLIKIELEAQGYKCEVANDGEIASDYIENNRYDLILLDIMLPKVDGYELLEYIKQIYETPTIFNIMQNSYFALIALTNQILWELDRLLDYLFLLF